MIFSGETKTPDQSQPPATPQREHPWHERRVGTKQHQWFARMGSLHRLTTAWNDALRSQQANALVGHQLTRGLSVEASRNIWMLDSLVSEQIEPLLDDTWPEDVLGRLEHTVWSVQSWTLLSLVERTPASELGALGAMLEQVAWKEGRAVAERVWPKLTGSAVGPDLREVLLALGASLVSGFGLGEDFLVRRALSREIDLELRGCAHRSPYGEVAPAADRLCQLHAQWMRGFAYALNNRAAVDHRIGAGEERCRQRWHLVS
jgi:hypothetical protein